MADFWILILFVTGTAVTVVETALSLYGNEKQARIAAEKELQHIRYTCAKRAKTGQGVLREIGRMMHETAHIRTDYEKEHGYDGTDFPEMRTYGTGVSPSDMLNEADRRAMEEMRLANQRDMAFAYMSTNQAMNETMRQQENASVQIDSTMFF